MCIDPVNNKFHPFQVYLDHFSHVFLFLLFFCVVAVFNHCRIQHGGCIIYITFRYCAYFIFFYDRVVLWHVSPAPSKGWLAPSGTTGTVSWLTTVSTCSYGCFKHQKIRLGNFESVETCFEAVTIPQTIQAREYVIVHWTAVSNRLHWYCTKIYFLEIFCFYIVWDIYQSTDEYR